MKNYLIKHGYLIYFGICMLIMNPFNIFKISNWFMLIVLFVSVELGLNAWKNKNSDSFKNYLLRIGWSFILGICCSCLTPITGLKWWIINIPVFILCTVRILKIEKS